MESIGKLERLAGLLAQSGTKKRVIFINPRDNASRKAMQKAEENGFIEPVIVDDDDPRKAAAQAVEMAKEGKGDLLFKGLIGSDIVLKAVLDKENGILPPGKVLTHIAVADIPSYRKLLFYTDAAVLPYPTQAQRVEQVKYLTILCRALGVVQPRVSLIHCSEKPDPRHFPFTEEYAAIINMANKGSFGDCIIDGPLDVKTSLSVEAMRIKGLRSPIGGEADALVFPDIESANVFYKTITLFGAARVAALLQGTEIPVVLPSRGDAPESKYYSILMAALASSAGQ